MSSLVTNNSRKLYIYTDKKITPHKWKYTNIYIFCYCTCMYDFVHVQYYMYTCVYIHTTYMVWYTCVYVCLHKLHNLLTSHISHHRRMSSLMTTTPTNHHPNSMHYYFLHISPIFPFPQQPRPRFSQSLFQTIS